MDNIQRGYKQLLISSVYGKGVRVLKEINKVCVSESRLVREFTELTALDSPSFGERKVADFLTAKLKELGFSVEEDRAWEKAFSKENGIPEEENKKGKVDRAGNLYGFLKGSIPGDPVLFSAHMDTVEPSRGKKAILESDGTIHSDGTTVLGADDAAGLVEILEGIRAVLESGYPHRDIEVLFPIAEELYTVGTSSMTEEEFGKIKAKEAYVPDMSGTPGTAANQAPSLISFRATVTGRASHAGFEPEKGIHAIQAAAEAVSKIKMGHIDKETTCNIGVIRGGSGTNIVPETCTAEGEIRSYVHEKALACMDRVTEIFRQTAESCGASADVRYTIHLHAYETELESVPVRRFRRVCQSLGLAGDIISTFGGSDNNTFAEHGIKGLVLSCGMYQAHSVKEYTRTADLAAGAKLIAGLILDAE